MAKGRLSRMIFTAASMTAMAAGLLGGWTLIRKLKFRRYAKIYVSPDLRSLDPTTVTRRLREAAAQGNTRAAMMLRQAEKASSAALQHGSGQPLAAVSEQAGTC